MVCDRTDWHSQEISRFLEFSNSRVDDLTNSGTHEFTNFGILEFGIRIWPFRGDFGNPNSGTFRRDSEIGGRPGNLGSLRALPRTRPGDECTIAGWRMADGARRMAAGRRRLADGGWPMAHGAWRIPDGAWRMAEAVLIGAMPSMFRALPGCGDDLVVEPASGAQPVAVGLGRSRVSSTRNFFIEFSCQN
jgi:hypothetical protein